jgi:hypothetical protein
MNPLTTIPLIPCTLLAVLLVGPAAADPAWQVLETTKVVQLTGDFDRQLQQPTRNLTNARAGVEATDLGSSFEHNGGLVFLFGDTWGRPEDRDFLATSQSIAPEDLELSIPLADDGRFLPLTPGDLETGAFCVPSCGISVNGAMYVLYTGNVGDRIMSRSHLIRSEDNGRSWRVIYEMSADDPGTEEFDARFVNGYFAQDEDGTIYMWGSGSYRKSDLYLARTTPDRIDDREGWQFLTALQDDEAPIWGLRESEAVPVLRSGQIGEFSCAFATEIGQWVLLYNAEQPRGITLHTAPNPWGPWSAPLVIFEPRAHHGYGHFMHIAEGHGPPDGLQDPGREKDWGGEYGPYLIPRFSGLADDTWTLHYTMSTWNPYQVVLMRTRLGRAE